MNLDNYVDVPTRLSLALQTYRDLRVTESLPTIVQVGDAQFVQVTCTVWRTPDDPIPCQASAWEPIPGRSAFTKDSEMMNASTSALGRALGLMGLGINSGAKLSMSSKEEVRNRTDDSSGRAHTSREAGNRPPLYTEPDPAGELERPVTRKVASDPQKKLIRRLCAEKNYTYQGDLDFLGMGDAIELIDLLKAMEEIR